MVPPLDSTGDGARSDGATDIVILGGGYVAVWAYRSIVRHLRTRIRTGAVRITVIAASPDHAFHGWTGEVLSGLVRFAHTRTPLVDLMPLAHVVSGVVTDIDLDRQTVTAEWQGQSINRRYDQLLVGIGSQDAADGIVGLADHGFGVKGDRALHRTVAHLDEVVERAAATSDAEERTRLLSVVVAGGGFAGVEAAAAIADGLAARIDANPILRGTVRPTVTVVHAGDHLLAEIRPRFERIADYATRELTSVGIAVKLERRLTAVTPTGAALDDGRHLPAATVVSTVGQRPVALRGTESLERDGSGRITTDGHLRTSRSGVWAGGDVAAVPHIIHTTPCPPNALWAIKHGVRVGDNIGRTVSGRGLRRFRYLGLGQAASLGVGRGAAELYGVQLTGWVAWMARWGFFHFFMPSRRTAMRTIRDWLAIPLRGRQRLSSDRPHHHDAPRTAASTAARPTPVGADA